MLKMMVPDRTWIDSTKAHSIPNEEQIEWSIGSLNGRSELERCPNAVEDDLEKV